MLSNLGIAASSAFNPLTAFSWIHAGWASDPKWANPGDGNKVSDWRNVSGIDPVQATSARQPIYSKSISNVNNRPGITFSSTNSTYLDIAITAIKTAVSVIVIGNCGGADGVAERFLSGDETAQNNGIGHTAANAWTTYNLTGSGTIDSNPHLFTTYCNSTNSIFYIDGVTNVPHGTTGLGSNGITRLSIGAGVAPGGGNGAYYLVGSMSFYGYYSGDITANPKYNTFKRWVANYYGLTIS